MTAPSEPVRPADEETVQALAEAVEHALRDDDGEHWRHTCEWRLLICDRDVDCTTRAVVASEPWQRLVRERDEARAAQERLLDEIAGLREVIRTAESSLVLAYGEPCNCGFGGFHDPANPRCDRNRAALRGDAECIGCKDDGYPYGLIPTHDCPVHDTPEHHDALERRVAEFNEGQMEMRRAGWRHMQSKAFGIKPEDVVLPRALRGDAEEASDGR